MWDIGDLALVGDERPDDLVAPVLQMLERMKQERRTSSSFISSS